MISLEKGFSAASSHVTKTFRVRRNSIKRDCIYLGGGTVSPEVNRVPQRTMTKKPSFVQDYIISSGRQKTLAGEKSCGLMGLNMASENSIKLASSSCEPANKFGRIGEGRRESIEMRGNFSLKR